MTMMLHVPGASPAEIARGLAAAHAVLARMGVTPLQAAEALFKRDAWAALGYPDGGEPSPIENAAADAFEVAEEAAILACCAGWASVPDDANLGVLPDEAL